MCAIVKISCTRACAIVIGVVMENYFERKAYEQMLAWKRDWAPRYALFLRGARRVGKTTLAEKFAREQYRSHILVRFDQVETEIRDLFVNSLRDLDTFFSTLEFAYQTKLYEHESLIVLDEIQLFLPARQALKTLLEDGRFDYLETGSLASIEKRAKDILIPSEEHFVDVLPMDFEEYLLATKRPLVMPAMRERFEALAPMGALHQQTMKAYREWMLVGGMPQAVQAFVDTHDFGRADFAKQRIISLYESDMEDQNEERTEYVRGFFERIPSELSKHDKRYVISHVGKGARMREYAGPIRWLDQAMVVNIANNVDDPSAALNLAVTDPSFKCYLMDTGLLVSLAYRDGTYLNNELYKAILLDKLHVNEGMVVENATAQSLRSSGHRAFFYRETDDATRKTTMEVDFLLRRGGKVCPVEVKSSTSRSTKSLTKFREKFGKRVGTAYVLHAGELKREKEVIYLPYYMAPLL